MTSLLIVIDFFLFRRKYVTDVVLDHVLTQGQDLDRDHDHAQALIQDRAHVLNLDHQRGLFALSILILARTCF